MRRRNFIALFGGAAVAWPLAARAQQPAMPVIGYLNPGSLGQVSHLIPVFRQSLAEAGYVEGENVMIEYRWAESRSDRLPELAADLVRREVAVIVCGATTPTALAAKAATATIPIVFGVGDNPVKLGLVASLARPGGNATGVNFFIIELGAKQLGLLRELVPAAGRVGLLVNPSNPTNESLTKDVTAAASAIGAQIEVVHARDSGEIEAAFAALVRNKVGALLVGADGLFFNRRVQVVTLATRYGIPAVYSLREYAEAGGLMSYGTSLAEVFRQIGIYTGQILKGAKPADLPVVQSTKFEFVINLPTARALGIEIPPTLSARADEVIE
jgi:putative ABC transport system substrate-binding protein